MIYRICLSVQPGMLQLEDDYNWKDGQVHAQYPKTSGSVGEHITDLLLATILSQTAPNVSVSVEPLTGNERNSGTPISCYGSLHRNQRTRKQDRVC